MPKVQILFDPGKQISSDLREFLSRNFSSDDLSKLEVLGGRLTIAMSFPKKRTDPKLIIDDQFIAKLKNYVGTEKELDALLELVPVKQLKVICEKLNLSVQSNMRSQSIRGAIKSHVMSSQIWSKVAGTSEGVPGLAETDSTENFGQKAE